MLLSLGIEGGIRLSGHPGLAMLDQLAWPASQDQAELKL